MKHAFLTLLTATLVSAANKIYTGFNYGAFWGEHSNVKRYADFHQGFELAKNLTDTPVPFDSARLYTCITAGTKDDPTEAFQAAVDTGTNLLLGMWISPGANHQSNSQQVDNELAALGKGFEQYGQKLADLVIGLSVGSEDVYRFNNAQVGISSNDLLNIIKSVREKIAASPYAKYMQGKPIGHTDTALYSAIPGSDFVGMNAYPYWEGKSIENANAAFMSSLKDTQRRAGNTPVWITELGWPVSGSQIDNAVASSENYQKYWDEVGCSVFGKYNTFWFELLQDSTTDQPDWGLLDSKTHMPQIKDLSCGSKRTAGDRTKILDISASRPQPTTFSTVYFPVSAKTSATPFSTKQAANLTAASTQSVRTTRITQTRTITVTPPSTATLQTNHGANHDPADEISVCITMTDLQDKGIFIPVATFASNMTACSPPPQFTGSPLTMIDVSAAVPAASSNGQTSFDVYAPSTAFHSAAMVTTTTSAHNSDGPTCLTSAGVAYEAVILNGKTFLGPSTPFCPSQMTEVVVSSTDLSSGLMTVSSFTRSFPPTLLPTSSAVRTLCSLSASPPSTLSTMTTLAATPRPAPPPALPRSTVAASYSPTQSLTPSPTTPPTVSVPTPADDPDCILVNSRWWRAALDSDGRRRISGTGVECTSPPTTLASAPVIK